MKFIPLLLWIAFPFALATAQSVPNEAIDGTTGAPLGGIGCGAIKFCAYQGTFSGTFRTPCALDNFQAMANLQFQFYSKSGQSAAVTSAQLKAVQTGGRADDDAVGMVDDDTVADGVDDGVEEIGVALRLFGEALGLGDVVEDCDGAGDLIAGADGRG